jgi:hypothetical protein
MSKKPEVLRTQPDGQPTALWNAFKRVIKDMGTLTNEQIAALHYESWHAAFVRSEGVEPGSV